MKKRDYIVSIAVGAIFVLSGVGKSLNTAGFQQLIHSYGCPYLDLLAPVIIIAELLLGWLLVMGYRVKTTSLLTAIMLIVFTGIYTFGYTRVGITDCGCFGVAQTKQLPAWTVYARNILLLGLLNYLYFSRKDEKYKWTNSKVAATSVYLAIGIFLTGMSFRPAMYLQSAPHPLEGRALKSTALGEKIESKGSTWVLCYSYSCSHCLNTMENYLATERYGRVDTAVAVALTSPEMATDSLREEMRKIYPQVVGIEIAAEALPEIKQLPTSLLIEEDTIREVWVGEMPNPYLIETNKTKQEKQ